MDIKLIAIVGAADMGAGIAHVVATAGFSVNLWDRDPIALEKAIREIEEGIDRRAARKALTEEQAIMAKKNVSGYLPLDEAVKEADVAIEAVSGGMGVKRELMVQLDRACRDLTILASNTAGLSITEMATATNRPDKVIGMHFFRPAHRMKLVEIVRGYATSDETAARVRELAGALGKTGIEVKDAPGFLIDRILMPMINEAIFVLQEGLASADEIDQGMTLGANHPMGPLALADFIGLDRLLKVQQELYEQFRDPKYRPAHLLVQMVKAGELGRKTKKGFYQYT
jgi:3-hydroxybutyryl-CoA dehydrogenase